MQEDRDFKKNFFVQHELRRTQQYRKFIKKARSMQQQMYSIQNSIGYRYLYTKLDRKAIDKAILFLSKTILKREFLLYEEYINVYIFHELQFPTKYIPEDQEITFLL